MPVQSSSQFRFGSGVSPLRMSQTRTPSPTAQPMFFDGSWKVEPESGLVVVVVAPRVTDITTVSVETTVCVSPTVSVAVEELFSPPPQPPVRIARPSASASLHILATLVLHVLHASAPPPSLLSRLREEPRVLAYLERSELSLELQVALEALLPQSAGLDRSPHCTAGLMQMAAIGEPALGGVGDHVGEACVEDAFNGPELQLAHPRRVEEQGTSGEGHELPVRRRVAPPALLARRRGREDVTAHQTVDQGRLAHSGGSEQRDGLSSAQVGRECFEARSGHGADGKNGNAECDRLHLRQSLGRGLGEVALVDDDDRSAAAVPGSGEVPLEPASVQILSERRDEKERVDVRSDDLLHGSPPRLLAREGRAPWQDGLDHRLPLTLETACGNPVAGNGQGGALELPRGYAPDAAVLREELAGAMVPRSDPRGYQSKFCMGPERVFELGAPA